MPGCNTIQAQKKHTYSARPSIFRSARGDGIIKSVLKQAEKLVVPSKKTLLEKAVIAKIAFELVDSEVAKHPQVRETGLGGSYPKGTWLPEKADIDVFIKFEKNVPAEKFAEIAKKIGFASLKKYKPYVRFSDHPYVEAEIKGTKVNVVPCYLVPKGQWQSAADRTQYHTEFMLENLSGPMKTSVRLLKQFLKNNSIYGAEISRRGFSGYAAEVLVWNYGNFEKVIRHMAGAKPGQVIGDAAKEFDTQISIIDPIDSRRNLAAAISNENIGRFVLLCRSFLKNPSVSFFKKQKKRSSAILLKNCITVSFKYRPRSPDTIWGQIKRAASTIESQLRIGGFNVIRSWAHTDEKNTAWLFFLLDSMTVSSYLIRDGPGFFSESDSRQFVSKNKSKSLSMWIGEDGKIRSLEPREEDNAQRFLSKMLDSNLGRSGIPSGIKADIKNGFRVSAGEARLSKSVKAQLRELIATDDAVFSSD